ncbi:MAG: Lrp/AsnC family transcriptional regulator [Mucilaginibacter sp.]|nr:Lrp/AsnC family transcriptional regulator [Mucilaginibacter sp.]
MQLDEIDLKILNHLQKDGRIDVAALSQKVNLSRTPVNRRIEIMQKQGFIKGFTVLLDREKVGRPVLIITHVKLEKQTTELLSEFESQVTKMPEVQFCMHVSGLWNFILHVSAVSPQAYFSFLMEKVNSLPNVAHTDSCFVMRECKTYGPLAL